MGNHIRNGRFFSDKYAVYHSAGGAPATADQLVLSFQDPAARPALQLFANMTADADLAIDIKTRLRVVEAEARDQGSGIRDQKSERSRP